MAIHNSQCPYEFTGNASSEFQEFFVAVWQFGTYANSDDFTGLGASVAMEVNLQHAGTPEQFADGITLWLLNCWAAELYMHFVESVLHKLPTALPDGELEINLMPTGSQVLLHLWHD